MQQWQLCTRSICHGTFVPHVLLLSTLFSYYCTPVITEGNIAHVELLTVVSRFLCFIVFEKSKIRKNIKFPLALVATDLVLFATVGEMKKEINVCMSCPNSFLSIGSCSNTLHISLI